MQALTLEVKQIDVYANEEATHQRIEDFNNDIQYFYKVRTAAQQQLKHWAIYMIKEAISNVPK